VAGYARPATFLKSWSRFDPKCPCAPPATEPDEDAVLGRLWGKRSLAFGRGEIGIEFAVTVTPTPAFAVVKTARMF
jgi:hypothetical protein